MGKVEIKENWSPSDFQPGDVVLCRNNAPLIKMAFRLLKAGIAPQLRGRDFSANLESLIRKILKKPRGSNIISSVTCYEFASACEIYFDTARANAIAKKHEAAIETLDDQAECLDILSDDARAVGDILANIKTIFESNGRVILSTIHKAKGLEFPRVYLLDPDLMPSKWALRAAERDPSRQWMVDQEYNLLYVAITRAASELYFIPARGLQPAGYLAIRQLATPKEPPMTDDLQRLTYPSAHAIMDAALAAPKGVEVGCTSVSQAEHLTQVLLHRPVSRVQTQPQGPPPGPSPPRRLPLRHPHLPHQGRRTGHRHPMCIPRWHGALKRLGVTIRSI